MLGKGHRDNETEHRISGGKCVDHGFNERVSRRQSEIRELSEKFTDALNTILSVRTELTYYTTIVNSNNEYEDEEEDLESEGDQAKRDQVLLLMHEIDVMRRDVYKIITWFGPRALKKSLRLQSMKNGTEHVY
jgi:hypothetical protein